MADSGNQGNAGRRRWELDSEALDALLEALAPGDRTLAGRRYEEMRRRLMDLFAWERCEAPDEVADRTLNRLARKLAEGTSIPHLDRFAFGIARFLLHEEARSKRNRESALRELRIVGGGSAGEEREALAAIGGCLEALPGQSRVLIERYYSEDRDELARRLGISVNALRNRALRIREELYRCVSRKRAGRVAEAGAARGGAEAGGARRGQRRNPQDKS